MSKVLKVVGAVAGVAAAAVTGGLSLGLSASLLAGVSTAATLGASLLAKKPRAPQASPADRDRLIANIDTRTPRKIVYGRTAMATDIRDQEFTGTDQEFFHRFVVVAAHKVGSIEQIYFDDKLAWTSAGGVQGEFSGYLTVATRLEGSAANAINISSRMGSTRRFTGLAYVHFRYKLTGNSKKSESPFAQAIPTRVTIIGNGMPIYDPRKDPTYGGSGTHRSDDQATWDWGSNTYRNPALQLLNHFLGWRINGKLSVGKGVPIERIDVASFIAGANLCDEVIALAAGGTEPRYRTDGIFSEADPMELVLDQFKSSMNATLDDVDGQIRLQVLHNDLALPIASFDENDILGAVDWKPQVKLDEQFNILRGTFTDPSTNALYQSVAYPEIEIDSRDGIDRVETINYPLVQSTGQCQRLAKQRLQRMEFSGLFSGEFQATAWKVQKGDVVELTFEPLGFDDKLFRVLDADVKTNGRVSMLLREEDALVYAWDQEESAAVVPAPPDTYDYQLNPLYLDVTDPRYVDGTRLEDLQPAEPDATRGAPAGTPVAGLDAGDLLTDLQNAQADAAQSKIDLINIAADGILTAVEKLDARERRDNISAEFPIWRDRASAFQITQSIQDSYILSYNELITYLNGVNVDSSVQNFVVRADFIAAFVNYATARERVIEALTEEAAKRADIPFGQNYAVNTDFSAGVSGWRGQGTDFGVNAPFGALSGIRNTFQYRFQGTPALGTTAIAMYPDAVILGSLLGNQYRYALPVGPGDKTFVRALLARYRCISRVQLRVYDKDGNFVESVSAAGGFLNGGQDGDPDRFEDVSLFRVVTAPDAAWATVNVLMESTGENTPVIIVAEPMICKVPQDQTVAPIYVPGRPDPNADATVEQPVVSRLDPSTGRALSRRINSQIMASGVLQTINTNPLTGTTSGSSSTITINGHTVFDDAGSLTFSAASISGLNPSTQYYVYESNPDFVGGARSYVASTNRNDITGFGRRFVGNITTPASGGASTGGGGGGAGGGWVGGGSIP
ncbi:phage tail protein [Erythrobacter rubeus]|uniref:Tip attachment protein J domain-containing protein n=1 Tax=Erythrobacter rubeus TaxID=2760803 RepID=A0ABR8KRZ1_9SPHN|nr:hypothetical protein [Erythrobacter rubeus]MBD2842714.1 hypothetical protein [Erythrobacter rubeus]